MYACVCRGITEADVRRTGRAGVVAPADLIAVLRLDAEDCCGRCRLNVDEFVTLASEGAFQGTSRLVRAAPDATPLPVPPAVMFTPRTFERFSPRVALDVGAA